MAASLVLLAVLVPPVTGQFDTLPPPPELESIDFLLGDWTVEGRFRTPDRVAGGALWYETADGVARFDGSTWQAFDGGAIPEADSVLAGIERDGRGEPFPFTHQRHGRVVQEGFAILVDDGRTGGTALWSYDSAAGSYVASDLHAPTNTQGQRQGSLTQGRLVMRGAGTDRRGPRIFRRTYELNGFDSYVMRTDVSFDDGVTWIEDQVVAEVRRRSPPSQGGGTAAIARGYLQTLLGFRFADLGPLVHDSLTFVDRAWGGPGVHGATEVLGMLPDAFGGIEVARVEVVTEIVGPSGRVLFVLDATGSADVEGTTINFHIPQVTEIRVDDERVIEHNDFPDYGCWELQTAAQAEGPLPFAELPRCEGWGWTVVSRSREGPRPQ